MPKPRICFVSENFYGLLEQNSRLNLIGGAELQQLLLAQELSLRGYDVSFVTKNAISQKTHNTYKFRIFYTFKPDDGLPVIRFFYPRIYKTWKALKDTNADIYYVRCAGHLLGIVVLFAKFNNKKVIFCAADEFDFDKTRINRYLPYKDKTLYFWGLRRANRIIAQNIIQKNLLANNFHKNSDIIHNGFLNLKSSSQTDELVLWVGNFKAAKRPELFLELATNFPNQKFIIIGGKQQGNIYATQHY